MEVVEVVDLYKERMDVYCFYLVGFGTRKSLAWRRVLCWVESFWHEEVRILRFTGLEAIPVLVRRRLVAFEGWIEHSFGRKFSKL